ncbi:GNAT family N-acetyltransferase [Flavisolibacter ginsenosidimutans]|uniref:GNAT family N-acetyltransferase n=1 Tax=Flavisolibacter ginsenosidimutans TaxID=661481 RepID=A0A5B8UNL3_9BACT|nr:GNAT family N-acetyltransferase [Flavisolibacter ginsenosidimutans]QEC58257.1 GNAT family N-acetyltransferase [Flavisolibacter ginsenosidimutans]
MQFNVRSVSIEDAQAVNELSAQLGYSVSLTGTVANIQQLLSSKEHCCFVAVHDLTVIGWIHGFLAYRIESNPFAEIGGLVVEESFRGKGIGKMLVDRVKEWSLEQGMASLRLRSNAKRKEAHEFYEKLGFTVTKEQKVFEMRLDKK